MSTVCTSLDSELAEELLLELRASSVPHQTARDQMEILTPAQRAAARKIYAHLDAQRFKSPESPHVLTLMCSDETVTIDFAPLQAPASPVASESKLPASSPATSRVSASPACNRVSSTAGMDSPPARRPHGDLLCAPGTPSAAIAPNCSGVKIGATTPASKVYKCDLLENTGRAKRLRQSTAAFNSPAHASNMRMRLMLDGKANGE
ncbi:MAG: hypothetical protein SGPRY_007907 [Prymnesium sp.]